MSQDEVKKYLDKGKSGAPLVNPDEQHKYLGTFRERCYLTITINQIKQSECQQALVKEFSLHPEAHLLINGKTPQSLQNVIIQSATKHNINFTIVNDFVKDDPDSFGVILAAKEAVNEPIVNVAEKYPLQNLAKKEVKKETFWSKLFH